MGKDSKTNLCEIPLWACEIPQRFLQCWLLSLPLCESLGNQCPSIPCFLALWWFQYLNNLFLSTFILLLTLSSWALPVVAIYYSYLEMGVAVPSEAGGSRVKVFFQVVFQNVGWEVILHVDSIPESSDTVLLLLRVPSFLWNAVVGLRRKMSSNTQHHAWLQ